MKCSSCGFENRDGVWFCEQCGTQLEIGCPNCGATLPGDRKFCGECGRDLRKPKETAPLDLSQPHAYTPKHLTDKILTTRSSIEGERKLVTVLFADVANYTSLAEHLDPEQVHGIMDGCFRIVTDKTHGHEGTINQFTGDGVMALFGAPVAHEDHAQRACHAALAIQKAMAAYGEKIQREYGVDFQMRIGLNSGPVIVGSIGDDLRMDYTAVGDTTNLASRMESVADPGSIVVSGNTHKMTREYFTFESLGEVEVKGKRAPQEVYELVQASEVETRMEASEARGLTRFVGRQREMQALTEALEKVQSGSGQVVGMVGEPGVGKSRALRELRRQLAAGEATYLEGRCLHFGGAMPYLPLLDVLRSYCGIQEGDSAFVRKKKISDTVLGLGENLEHIIAPIQDLLSLPVDDEAYQKLEPKQKRERTFEALRDLLIRESQERPLVVAIEDVHWIDQTSQEFLDYLVGWLGSARILVILLYRPEYTHPWGSRSYYTKIGVDLLSPGPSVELLRSILGGADVAAELQVLILDRSGGNPLFVEELTRCLLENGSIRKEDHQYALNREASNLHVPGTIEGIIAARIDRLEDHLKRIMQVASVIGRGFSFRVLQAVMGTAEELKIHLRNLRRFEFVRERQILPELEYIFKHELIQEVAYNSLLATKRKEIHETIGRAIEEIHMERLEEFYERLAYHYSKSDKLEKASQYLKLSGDKSHAKHSPWEAFHLYKEALDALVRLPGSEENKRSRIELCLASYRPAVMLGFPEDSLEIFRAGETLCKDVGDERSLIRFYQAMSLYYQFKVGDVLAAVKHAENALRAAEETQDIDVIASSAIPLTLTYFFAGYSLKISDLAPEVLDRLERSGKDSDFFGMLIATYPGLCAVYGCSLGMLGNFAQGEVFCEKGLQKAKEIDDLRTQAFVEAYYGQLYITKGEGQLAAEHLQVCVEYCEKSKYLLNLGAAWARLGVAHYLLGNLVTARKQISKGVAIQNDLGVKFMLPYCYYYESMIHLDCGDTQKALQVMEKARELAENMGEKHYEGMTRIGLGKILGKIDPTQTQIAEESIRQGIHTLETLKLRSLCSGGYRALGELYADVGHNEKAMTSLKIAERMGEEMGMIFWLDKTREALARLQD
jgi:class 3 adenylate cyclase/tetratricopeptide (TPR) repeat protein